MATTLPTYDILQKTDFSLYFTFMTLTGWKHRKLIIENEENTIMRQICGMMRIKWDKCMVELRRDSGVGFFQDPATWASEELRHDWYTVTVVIMTHYYDHDKPRFHDTRQWHIALQFPNPHLNKKVSLSKNSFTTINILSQADAFFIGLVVEEKHK